MAPGPHLVDITNSELTETRLSEVEGWGRAVIDELISQLHSLDPQQAAKFAGSLPFSSPGAWRGGNLTYGSRNYLA
ncbi:MAG: hypothetical protein QOH48_1412 [Actinomycetota bacterium]|jgi:hypothetical protein|nr:hypothetical protein [Actinomycetota bacterium]